MTYCTFDVYLQIIAVKTPDHVQITEHVHAGSCMKPIKVEHGPNDLKTVLQH